MIFVTKTYEVVTVSPFLLCCFKSNILVCTKRGMSILVLINNFNPSIQFIKPYMKWVCSVECLTTPQHKVYISYCVSDKRYLCQSLKTTIIY